MQSSGSRQVLRAQMFGPVNEKQAEYLDDMLAIGAATSSSLINDVLDLSRVEAGQVELEITPFSLREALESGVVMVRERAVPGRRQGRARRGSPGRRGRGGRT